jgi:hypothetical protein
VGALGLLAVPAFLLGARLAAPAHRPSADDDAPARTAALTPGGTHPRRGAPDGVPEERPAAEPAALLPMRPPAGLSIRITQLGRAPRVGETVDFRVHWSDGDGRYAGLVENWGDGTQASSLQVTSCTGRAGAHSGDLTLRHSWGAPGRYRVVLGVTTTRCVGQSETRTSAISVVVRAEGEAGAAGDRAPQETPTAGTSTLPVLAAVPTPLADVLPSLLPTPAETTPAPTESTGSAGSAGTPSEAP